MSINWLSECVIPGKSSESHWKSKDLQSRLYKIKLYQVFWLLGLFSPTGTEISPHKFPFLAGVSLLSITGGF